MRGSNSARCLVAVDARHADVTEDRVRPEVVDSRNSGWAVVSDSNGHSQAFHQEAEASPDVVIVVDDENARQPIGLAIHFIRRRYIF